MISPLSAETIQRMPESEISPALRLVRSSLPEALRSRVRSARDLSRSLREEEEEHPPLATAVPALDRLLDGGLPRGQLVELVGGRTSGRFSTLLAALAAATGVGEAAALVDLGDGLDPEAAAAPGGRPRAPPLGAPDPAQGSAGGGRDAARRRLPPGRRRPRQSAGARRARRRGRLAAPRPGRPRPRRGAAGGHPLPGERHRRRRGPQGGARARRLAGRHGALARLLAASPRASRWRSTAAGSPAESEGLELCVADSPLAPSSRQGPAGAVPEAAPGDAHERWQEPLRAARGRRCATADDAAPCPRPRSPASSSPSSPSPPGCAASRS